MTYSITDVSETNELKAMDGSPGKTITLFGVSETNELKVTTHHMHSYKPYTLPRIRNE